MKPRLKISGVLQYVAPPPLHSKLGSAFLVMPQAVYAQYKEPKNEVVEDKPLAKRTRSAMRTNDVKSNVLPDGLLTDISNRNVTSNPAMGLKSERRLIPPFIENENATSNISHAISNTPIKSEIFTCTICLKECRTKVGLSRHKHLMHNAENSLSFKIKRQNRKIKKRTKNNNYKLLNVAKIAMNSINKKRANDSQLKTEKEPAEEPKIENVERDVKFENSYVELFRLNNIETELNKNNIPKLKKQVTFKIEPTDVI